MKNVGLDKITDVLEGTTAIAISKDDQTAPARILGKFADDKKEYFNIKAGFIGEEIYDEKGVMASKFLQEKFYWHNLLVHFRTNAETRCCSQQLQIHNNQHNLYVKSLLKSRKVNARNIEQILIIKEINYHGFREDFKIC